MILSPNRSYLGITRQREHMAMATDGLTTIRSGYGPEETMNRLEAEVRAKGMTVFAHIDHAAGATAARVSVRPTELCVFGNATAGTPPLRAWPTTGPHQPLKTPG